MILHQVIFPYKGLGATARNIVGNFLPHTICGVNKEKDIIETTEDFAKLIKDEKTKEEDYKFTANLEGKRFKWKLRPDGYSSRKMFIPYDIRECPYVSLEIGNKSKYINPNL